MKITNITSFIHPEYLTHIVRVETDEGVTGYGECSPMSVHVTAQIVRDNLKPRLLGLDPFDVETAEKRAITGNYKIRGQLLAMSWSGVELALRDIQGKALGMPVYRLLGGRCRDEVEFYASSMDRSAPPQVEAENMARLVEEMGVSACKIKIGGRIGSTADIPDLDQDAEKVRLVREAIGPKIRLILDCNSSYTLSQALLLWSKIEKYDIYHFEEPCPYWDVRAYKTLAEKLPVPLNIGEQDWDLTVFRQFLEAGACHIVAADLVKSGGFTACKRVAALCRAYNAVFAPHNTSRAIGFAANMQLAACTPEYSYYQEFNIEPRPLQEQFLLAPYSIHNGKYFIPDTPGIGAPLDIEKLMRIAERVD